MKDLYSAKNQLVKTLPEMADAASSPQLKESFTLHLAQTRQQVERLKQIFQALGESPGGMKCKGMEGLLEEGQEVLGKRGSGPIKDIALIGAAQRVEHYEMAGYESVLAVARQLGQTQAVDLLQQSMQEEQAAAQKLSQLAQNSLSADNSNASN